MPQDALARAGALPPDGSGAAPGARGAHANRIKFSWLLKLHWASILAQTAVVALVGALGIVSLPIPVLLALVAVQGVATLAAEIWFRRTAVVPEGALAGVMLFDTVALTVFLAFSGSFSNPFSILYLANVALSAVLLGPAWSWGLLAFSLLAFGSLFVLDRFWHHGFALSDLGHPEIVQLHMKGLWVAFAVGASFILYIVNRVTRELRELERQLEAARSLSARNDKVASLATLAAGAAHELSTPLATIAVVTRELERSLAGDARPGVVEDLGLIRIQLGRCQEILRQMSAHAGTDAGESIVTMSLAEWAASALENLPERSRVTVAGAPQVGQVEGPARALVRALRSLLKNALQVTPPGEQVELRLGADGDLVRAEVVDRGPGMPPEVLARAGEPFFTTKGPGEGIGLGLFLVRTLAEQLGGKLEIESTPGRGTTARLRLPSALALKTGGPA